MNKLINIKGRGKAAREAAYAQIAPLSFVENQSRSETIVNLRVALGKAPSDDEVAAARREWQIGRVASRLGKGDMPANVKSTEDRLTFARDLVLHYAAPPKEGAKARKLRAGQKGRRTVAQQRIVRAADEAWSQIKAELGAGEAQTQAQRNAKKRAPHHNTPQGKAKAKAKDAPTHDALLVKAPTGARDAVGYVDVQAASMLAYANKHAKVIPTDVGQAIHAFRSAMLEATKAFEKREAARDAKAAEKSK